MAKGRLPGWKGKETVLKGLVTSLCQSDVWCSPLGRTEYAPGDLGAVETPDPLQAVPVDHHHFLPTDQQQVGRRAGFTRSQHVLHRARPTAREEAHVNTTVCTTTVCATAIESLGRRFKQSHFHTLFTQTHSGAGRG